MCPRLRAQQFSERSMTTRHGVRRCGRAELDPQQPGKGVHRVEVTYPSTRLYRVIVFGYCRPDYCVGCVTCSDCWVTVSLHREGSLYLLSSYLVSYY